MTLRRFCLSALAAIAAAMLAVIAVSLPARAGSPTHNAPAAERSAQAREARAAIAAETAEVVPKLTAAGAGYERDGVAPELPLHTRALGPVTSTATMRVDLSLVPRDARALAQFATDVATPGNADYRHYISGAEFAATYGATPASIAAVTAAMKATGLQVEPASTNGLELQVSGTPAEVERAFSTQLDRYELSSGRMAFANTTAPRIASSAAGYVNAVVGLNDLAKFEPQYVKPGKATAASASTSGLLGVLGTATTAAASGTSTLACTSSGTSENCPVGTPTTLTVTSPATSASYANGPTPCSFAQQFTGQESAPSGIGGTGILADEDYNYDQLAAAYDFDPLYRAGDLGQGVNVGIFELEPNYPNDPIQFDNCYGINTKVGYVHVDGTATPGSSDGEETALDISTITALAPDANVTVYQGDEDADTGWLDTFNTIVSADHDKVVSVSYGACELLESTLVGSSPQAEITIFEEAAAQGQSFVVSSGDAGAEGCRTPDAGTSAVAAVDDPGADPFVTGVGGTSLTGVNNTDSSGTHTAPTESIWNNGVALDLAGQGGGGGGGISSEWLMPDYQSNPLATTTTTTGTSTNNVAGLDIINSQSEGLSQNGGAICSGDVENALSDVYCREVPDVSASADPYYAYTFVYQGALTAVGGTSGAAPLWAALLTVADSSPGCQAHPVGFANPALYKLAATSSAQYKRDFNDITSGNNDAYGTNGGYFAAMSGYDMASGLGSPIAANLVPDLCPATSTTSGTTTTGTTTTGTATTGTTTTITSSSAGAGSSTSVTTPARTVTVVKTKTTTKKAVCKPSKRLTFVQHPAYPVVETKAVVYVDGKKVKTVRAKQIFQVVINRPKATKFTVRIVSTLDDGQVIAHKVTYNGCKRSKITFTVLHKADKRGVYGKQK